MIGPLAKIIRTSNLFKNVLRYFGKVWHKSKLWLLWFDWLTALCIFTPLPCNASFLIIKYSCVSEEHNNVLFFFRRNFNKALCKSIFLVSLHSGPLPPQLTLFPLPTTCTVDDFQHLRFGNSQSPNKFTGKPKTQIKIYIYIAHHPPIYKVNGTAQYLPR